MRASKKNWSGRVVVVDMEVKRMMEQHKFNKLRLWIGKTMKYKDSRE